MLSYFVHFVAVNQEPAPAEGLCAFFRIQRQDVWPVCFGINRWSADRPIACGNRPDAFNCFHRWIVKTFPESRIADVYPDAVLRELPSRLRVFPTHWPVTKNSVMRIT